jgi:hypothetical protein
VVDAARVDQRVRGDAGGDGGAECEGPAVAAPSAAHREDPERDEHDPGGREGGRPVADREAAEQHEHGRSASRDRVDDAHVRALVRPREQQEVRGLERARRE